MHPHAALIERFYSAFQQRDIAGMHACYHPDVVFSDPAFRHLEGDRARGMWAMLVSSGKDLQLVFSDVTADDQTGRAHWEADYTFSQTGRKVHNVIDATFRFQDGKIIRHIDSFDFWKWSRMALGLPGIVLGWSPPLQNKIRSTAEARLNAFMAKQAVKAGA